MKLNWIRALKSIVHWVGESFDIAFSTHIRSIAETNENELYIRNGLGMDV